QETPDVWVERMLDIASRWRPITWAEETGQIKSAVGPFIERRMQERKIPLYREQFPTKGDKSIRAQSIRGKMSMDGLYVPTKAAWYATFQQELLQFPNGKHDDQVDALGLIGQLLDIAIPGKRPDREKKVQFDPTKDAYRAMGTDAELEAYARGG